MKQTQLPELALIYDFDGTRTGNMQSMTYSRLGVQKVSEYGKVVHRKQKADPIPAYMCLMLRRRRRQLRITRMHSGPWSHVRLFRVTPGSHDRYGRTRLPGRQYIVSSGLVNDRRNLDRETLHTDICHPFL
jgi:hypothetical protein